jgi:hypothetical protein
MAQIEGVMLRRVAGQVQVTEQEATIVGSVSNLEVRHPALHGQLDSKMTLRGSVMEPIVGGEMRVSRGSIVVSTASASSFGPPSKPVPPTAASLAAPPVTQLRMHSPSTVSDFPSIFQHLFPSEAAAPPQISREQRLPPAPPKDTPLTLEDLNITLGPDLRITSFPFLQLNLSGSLSLSGAPDPDLLEASGDIQLSPGVVNVFATQFILDRNHSSHIVFDGSVMNPFLDMAMASREFRIDCQSRLRDARQALTITRLSDGSTQTLSGTAGSMLFQQQLKALLLENDGQIAVQSMVMNALSTMLPRFEGSGSFGNAQWRLVGGFLAVPLVATICVSMPSGSASQCDKTRLSENLAVITESEVPFFFQGTS